MVILLNQLSQIVWGGGEGEESPDGPEGDSKIDLLRGGNDGNSISLFPFFCLLNCESYSLLPNQIIFAGPISTLLHRTFFIQLPMTKIPLAILISF